MVFSFRPQRLKRYKDIASLLIKHGRPELVQVSPLDQAFIQEDMADPEIESGAPEQLASDLEALGPTFIKLGQMLSTRPDLLPQPYLDALARLQDEVEPFPYEEIHQIITEELGLSLAEAFQRFDPEPIAAASLGQVHKAQLHSNRLVVVKVQRPGIRQIILDDLKTFDEIAAAIDQHTEIGRRYLFRDILAEFRKTLLQELDYRREAENLRMMRQKMANYERIVIPEPVKEYTTSRVLTMDYIDGTKITDLAPLAHLEVDGTALAEELTKAYLDQILADGFFHADPHPGNVFITHDHRLALIDLGMVARIPPYRREELLKLLLAVSEGRGRQAAKINMKIGVPLEEQEEERFTRKMSDLVARYQHGMISQVKVGRLIIEMARLAAEHGIRPALELAVLGKALLNLDEIGRILDPDFNPNEVVRSHSNSLMTSQMLKSFSPGNLFSSVLEINEFIQKLPARLNILLDTLERNQLEVKIEALDEGRLMENLQKIANRITMGLVLAALIVGAALMMSVESRFTILGYPALAIVLFVIAAAGGLALVINIFLNDVWGRRK